MTRRISIGYRMRPDQLAWLRTTSARTRVPQAALIEVALDLLRAELAGDTDGARWRGLVARFPGQGGEG